MMIFLSQGIAVALASSVISNLGVNLQKLSFIYELRKVSASPEAQAWSQHASSASCIVQQPLQLYCKHAWATIVPCWF
mgnify:CR=1 FL=1